MRSEQTSTRPSARRLLPWIVILLAAPLASAAAADQPAAPPASASTDVTPTTLNREQIRMVQRTLADKGYDVKTTSAWDDHTQAALASFQRSQRLPETGRLDTTTAQALGLDPATVMTVRGTVEDDRLGPYDRYDASDMDVNCAVNNTIDCRYGGGG